MAAKPGPRLRTVLAIAWVVLGILTFVIVGFTADWLWGITAACIVMSLTSSVYLIATWGSERAAQEQAFLDTYGSIDGAKSALDLDVLREVRDTQGVIPAIRKVRREHPAIPLAHASDIVRGL